MAAMSRIFKSSLVALALSATMSTSYAFTDSEARTAIIELRQQLRTLTETSQRASMQLAQRIDRLEQEITRLRAQLEELGAPAASQQSGSAVQERAQDSKEQAAFDGALDLYREANYKDSAASLSAFLTLYPESVLAPTAQFYLGSSQYVLKNYQEAISVLSLMAGKFPDHARAPDALLVVAGSQFELNQRTNAKATLEKILKTYPGTAAAQSAETRLKLL
jgi:tol-pal system protein YbgF